MPIIAAALGFDFLKSPRQPNTPNEADIVAAKLKQSIFQTPKGPDSSNPFVGFQHP